jgi:hypothetical protein
MKTCSLPPISPRFIQKPAETGIRIESELFKETEENCFIPAPSRTEKLAYAALKQN